jgi:short-subunit dehydrogenase
VTADSIWITGASTGIGRELALQLAAAGHQVFASARTRSTLEQLSEISSPYPIQIIPCDVSDRNSLLAAARDIESRVGCINKVIVNAGTCEYFSVSDPDWAMMHRVMAVNFFGAINTVEAALPLLRKAPKGNAHLIAVASLASVVPFSRAEAYGASKAALQYFFESLRVDLDSEAIAVTVIQPGFVETPLTAKNDFPMPFMLSAATAARIIVRQLGSKPRLIRFPRRLAWMLALMGHLPALWHYVVTKQLKSADEPQQNNHKVVE